VECAEDRGLSEAAMDIVVPNDEVSIGQTPPRKSWWYTYAEKIRHRHASRFGDAFLLSDFDLIHITSLVVILNHTISDSEKETRQEFSPTHIETMQTKLDEARQHNMSKCVEKRQHMKALERKLMPSVSDTPTKSGTGIFSIWKSPQTPKRPEWLPEQLPNFPKHPRDEIVELDECHHCMHIDNLSKQVRISELRVNLFSFCVTQSRNLLHHMLWMYTVGKTKYSRDVDVYLFFQLVFAMLRLHDAKYIFLRQDTVCGYFILMFQYFMEYYADHTVDLNELMAGVFPPGDPPIQTNGVPYNRDLWIKEAQQTFAAHSIDLCVYFFLLKRDNSVIDSSLYSGPLGSDTHNPSKVGSLCSGDFLHVHKRPESWNRFVERINRSYEVTQLRRDYHYVPFLFTLDLEKMLIETDV